jgi:uncharacterized protein YbbC (DUF1343 family)
VTYTAGRWFPPGTPVSSSNKTSLVQNVDISYLLQDVGVYAYCFRTGMAFVSLACMTAMDIMDIIL